MCGHHDLPTHNHQIGEVARVVHYLKKHLASKTIASVQVQEDNIIYGKVGTTASAFQAAMTGKKVLDARQQGKYFWLVMDSPPHPVMHLGMTGWIKFSSDDTSFYRPKKEEEQQWPPRFWKFILKTNDNEEVAFIDPRRLARIRLIDCNGEDLRKESPLKENGPDPVIDKGILTLDWFSNKMRSKKVPVKALLLDQANISGVGNWVADEVLYQARIHPEQYSNTFSDAQLKTLHDSLINVCTTACELLAESSKFPKDWLMKYRWDKGKKGEVNKLPNGNKIVHLKVGGRTSAIVPAVQKKTAAVAGDVASSEGLPSEEEADEGLDVEPAPPESSGKKRKASTKIVKEDSEEAPKRRRRGKAVKEDTETKVESVSVVKKKGRTGKGKAVKQESGGSGSENPADAGADGIEGHDDKVKETGGKTQSKGRSKTTKAVEPKTQARSGSRRSGRLSGNAR